MIDNRLVERFHDVIENTSVSVATIEACESVLGWLESSLSQEQLPNIVVENDTVTLVFSSEPVSIKNMLVSNILINGCMVTMFGDNSTLEYTYTPQVNTSIPNNMFEEGSTLKPPHDVIEHMSKII